MTKKINEEIADIDKQLSQLKKRREELVKQRANYSAANLQPGMKVRIIRDEWGNWGPSPGSIQYVHELADGRLYVGAKSRRNGSFWTSYDNVVIVED